MEPMELPEEPEPEEKPSSEVLDHPLVSPVFRIHQRGGSPLDEMKSEKEAPLNRDYPE